MLDGEHAFDVLAEGLQVLHQNLLVFDELKCVFLKYFEFAFLVSFVGPEHPAVQINLVLGFDPHLQFRQLFSQVYFSLQKEGQLCGLSDVNKFAALLQELIKEELSL